MMPSLHFKCLNCGHIFPADEAAQRPPELEDLCPPWVSVDICPNCKSDELQKLPRCLVCGAPVENEDSDFCEDCGYIIDEGFKGYLAGAIHELRRRSTTQRNDDGFISLILDRFEEQNYYTKGAK